MKIDIPLSLQAASGLVGKHASKDADEILDAMMRAADSITEASANVKAAHAKIMGDVMQPELKRLSNARKRVRELHDATSKKLTDTRDKVDRKLGELEASTLPCPKKDALGAVVAIEAMEIRGALRSMPQDQRLRAVRQAVEAGDANFVAAATTGSNLLTGMGDAEVSVARDMWQRAHSGPALERLQRLRAAQSQLDRLANLFTSWSGSIYAEKDAAVDAAERSAALAKSAMADVASVS